MNDLWSIGFIIRYVCWRHPVFSSSILHFLSTTKSHLIPMKTLSPRSFLTLAVACLITCISCSPIVAEYTYRGTVTNTTRGGRQTCKLNFKEYEDGTISGAMQTLKSSSSNGLNNSVRGQIQGNQIELRFTPHQVGQSNASAKIASVFDAISDGHQIFQGKIPKNRSYIQGQWNRKISDSASRRNTSHYQKGTFSFQLISKISHRKGTTRRASTHRKSTATSPVSVQDADSDMPTISVESAGGGSAPEPSQPISITVE